MIFCVEDDASICNMMVYTLTSSGFEAEGFADGGALFAALERRRPQLILLDIMLPGMDGLEILRRLRANGATADLPVIMATARGTEYDKVVGLDLGADDYLAKPFGMMEMVSRIRAVLRRATPATVAATLGFDGLCMDPNAHTLTLDGASVVLTLKEFALLRLFLKNPGQVFTREQLLEQVWETSYVGETRTVDVHMGTLRTKLGRWGSHVRTVRGVGYRLEVQP